MATVLVVDDDPDARLLARTLLEYAGHAVLEAGDGAAALACARSERPDLILFDLSMPAMSGTAFARAVRADAALRPIVLALYTATAMNPALRDFMEIYRVRNAIPKPSEPPEFLEAVERALSVTDAEL